jgi:hypothetical protein
MKPSKISKCAGLSVFWILLLAICLGLLSACVTEKAPAGPGSLSGVREYKEITAQSRTAVLTVLRSLDQMAAEPWPCPPKVAAAFSEELSRLEVGSIRVRARVQAIQARGDAYFADWSQAIAQIKDARVRDLAERCHPELQESYARIKSASQEAREVFRLFLGNLRALRIQLENGSTGGAAPTDLIRTGHDEAEKLLQILDVINNELQSITTRLTPPGTAAQK